MLHWLNRRRVAQSKWYLRERDLTTIYLVLVSSLISQNIHHMIQRKDRSCWQPAILVKRGLSLDQRLSTSPNIFRTVVVATPVMPTQKLPELGLYVVKEFSLHATPQIARRTASCRREKERNHNYDMAFFPRKSFHVG